MRQAAGFSGGRTTGRLSLCKSVLYYWCRLVRGGGVLTRSLAYQRGRGRGLGTAVSLQAVRTQAAVCMLLEQSFDHLIAADWAV
jgi:hypothetical protein